MDPSMLRSPGFTPAQAFAEPPALPPELFTDEDEDEPQNKSFGVQTSFARSPTELDYGPDGKPHVKPRQYRSHDNSLYGRILDFVGVPTHLTVSGMLKDLFKLFLPAAATTILYFCNQAITMMFVGRLLGTQQLAFYAVGMSVFNIVGLSIGLGMATALDTLCSQAYGRDSKGPEVGILLQRGLVVCLGLALPVIAGFFMIEPGLVMVFGETLGPGVGRFLRASPPYLVALIVNFCIQKTLQAQQLPVIAVWSNVASAVACPIFNYFLTPHGVEYAALAVALSVALAATIMFGFALFDSRSVVFVASWPSKEAIDGKSMVDFVKVGVPSMFSVVAEWWAFELIIAFSSRYGEDVVTAFTICMNVLTFMFAFPSGLAVSAGVLCGNFLGANDPRGAQSYARLSLIVGVCLVVTVNAGLVVFGGHVFELYTHDKKVLHLLNGVLGLLVVFHTGDALQSVFQGVFRGAGRQAMSARIVLVSLWIVGLPAAWYLGETIQPLHGILGGLIVGFVVEIPMMCIDMLFRWDWVALADAAATSKLADEEGEREKLAAARHDDYGTA